MVNKSMNFIIYLSLNNLYFCPPMATIKFNNKLSPFHDALIERAEAYFKNNNIRQTGNFKLYHKTIVLGLALVANYITLVFFTPPGWLAIMLCALLGITFATIGFNVMHDGAHGSYSQNKYVNNIMAFSLSLMGGSSFMWKAKHNLIHHSFTNIEGVDEDIDVKPWMRVNDQQPRYWFHRFQHIYWVMLYGVTYFMWVFFMDFQKYFKKRIGDIPLGRMKLKDHLGFWASKITYLSVFIIIPIFKVGLLDTVIGYAITSFVTGLVIAVVFQLAHIVTDTSFPQPDEQTNKIEQEWALHQVNTTANFATNNKFVSWMVGGLNFQVEHHLFPRISHIHYPEISKLVRDTCKEFNVRYIEYPTVLSAIKAHVSHLRDLGKAESLKMA